MISVRKMDRSPSFTFVHFEYSIDFQSLNLKAGTVILKTKHNLTIIQGNDLLRSIRWFKGNINYKLQLCL